MKKQKLIPALEAIEVDVPAEVIAEPITEQEAEASQIILNKQNDAELNEIDDDLSFVAEAFIEVGTLRRILAIEGRSESKAAVAIEAIAMSSVSRRLNTAIAVEEGNHIFSLLNAIAKAILYIAEKVRVAVDKAVVFFQKTRNNMSTIEAPTDEQINKFHADLKELGNRHKDLTVWVAGWNEKLSPSENISILDEFITTHDGLMAEYLRKYLFPAFQVFTSKSTDDAKVKEICEVLRTVPQQEAKLAAMKVGGEISVTSKNGHELISGYARGPKAMYVGDLSHSAFVTLYALVKRTDKTVEETISSYKGQLDEITKIGKDIEQMKGDDLSPALKELGNEIVVLLHHMTQLYLISMRVLEDGVQGGYQYLRSVRRMYENGPEVEGGSEGALQPA